MEEKRKREPTDPKGVDCYIGDTVFEDDCACFTATCLNAGFGREVFSQIPSIIWHGDIPQIWWPYGRADEQVYVLINDLKAPYVFFKNEEYAPNQFYPLSEAPGFDNFMASYSPLIRPGDIVAFVEYPHGPFLPHHPGGKTEVTHTAGVPSPAFNDNGVLQISDHNGPISILPRDIDSSSSEDISWVIIIFMNEVNNVQ